MCMYIVSKLSREQIACHFLLHLQRALQWQYDQGIMVQNMIGGDRQEKQCCVSHTNVEQMACDIADAQKHTKAVISASGPPLSNMLFAYRLRNFHSQGQYCVLFGLLWQEAVLHVERAVVHSCFKLNQVMR